MRYHVHKVRVGSTKIGFAWMSCDPSAVAVRPAQRDGSNSWQ